jgi:hypothetical protein
LCASIIFAGTGHTHGGRSHPGWVEVLSWVFLGCALALVVVGVQALRPIDVLGAGLEPAFREDAGDRPAGADRGFVVPEPLPRKLDELRVRAGRNARY